jgi:hypothetical protein
MPRRSLRAVGVADSEEDVIIHRFALSNDVTAGDFDVLGIDPAAILSQQRSNRACDVFRFAYAPSGA